MDVRMPGVDGIEATQRLLRDGDAPRVLILTTFDLDEYVYEALKAGASGFLLKDAPRDQLVGAVRTVAAGEALLAPGACSASHRGFRPSARTGRPSADRAKRLDRARARGADPGRARPRQRRDRGAALRQRGDRAHARHAISSRSWDSAIASRRSCSRTSLAWYEPASLASADSRLKPCAGLIPTAYVYREFDVADRFGNSSLLYLRQDLLEQYLSRRAGEMPSEWLVQAVSRSVASLN